MFFSFVFARAAFCRARRVSNVSLCDLSTPSATKARPAQRVPLAKPCSGGPRKSSFPLDASLSVFFFLRVRREPFPLFGLTLLRAFVDLGLTRAALQAVMLDHQDGRPRVPDQVLGHRAEAHQPEQSAARRADAAASDDQQVGARGLDVPLEDVRDGSAAPARAAAQDLRGRSVNPRGFGVIHESSARRLAPRLVLPLRLDARARVELGGDGHAVHERPDVGGVQVGLLVHAREGDRVVAARDVVEPEPDGVLAARATKPGQAGRGTGQRSRKQRRREKNTARVRRRT